MLKKWASAAVLDVQTHPRSGLIHSAARHEFVYTPRPGMLYVRSRMISSRCNDNWDAFPAEEIEKGYKTFLGKPVFVNHHNDDHRRMRGIIIDAVLHRHHNPNGSPDTWVEGLQEIDALTFPKLARRLLNRDIERTSMGVDVDYSICSACGNKATDTFSYCRHIPGMKGQKYFPNGRREGKFIFEKCFGLKFFENSLLVEEPADPTAVFTGTPVAGPGLEHMSAGLTRMASMVRKGADRVYPPATHRDFGPLWVEGAKYDTPDDHPWFRAHPVHPENIVHHWNQATPDEKNQGKRWYSDAHLVAKGIAHGKAPDHPQGETHVGAGMLAIYSPQQGWAGNMHNAARVLHEGHGIGGPGSGMFASVAQKTSADRLLGGEHYNNILAGPKIRDFAHLIEHGGDEHPPDHPEHVSHVVVDRHALSVAHGTNLSAEDYTAAPLSGSRRKDGSINRTNYDHVVKAYHQAAEQISKKEKSPVAPHQVQGVTWLVRQRLNQQQEHAKAQEGEDSRLNRGREHARGNAEQGWDDFRTQHLPDMAHHGPGTGYQGSRKTSYGETMAPPQVDTLRDENCPICGEDHAFSGHRCSVCGYVAPPSPFNDPDLDMASKIDLRQQQEQFDDTQVPDQDRAMEQEQNAGLICPSCGTEFPEEPAQSVDTMKQPGAGAMEETEEGEGAAEGDVCPACGKGVLEPEEEIAAEEAAEGDEPQEAPEDDEGPSWDNQSGVPVESPDGKAKDEEEPDEDEDKKDDPPVKKNPFKPKR